MAETDTQATGREELEASVAKGLAEVFADDSEELENLPVETEAKSDLVPPHKRPPTAEKSTEEVAEAEEPATEDPVSADAEKTDDTEKPAAEAAPDKGSTLLPAAYRRSLKAYEWTDEEIDSALAKGGEQFLGTAAKIHQTRSKELQQFAAAGRAAKTAPAKTEPTTSSEAIAPVDVAALHQIYGADEVLIAKMAEPLNRTIAEINKVLPKIRAQEQASQQQQLETFGRQLDTFFGSSDATETYGKTAGTATEAQLAERIKVVELADALIAGGRQQGRVLSLDEALQMAYDATTTVTKTATARKEITKTLEQRNRGITLKPGARVAPKAPDRSALESRVKGKLAAVFS